MTGFGRGNAGRGKNRIDVEIRAINSRYLDTRSNEEIPKLKSVTHRPK